MTPLSLIPEITSLFSTRLASEQHQRPPFSHGQLLQGLIVAKTAANQFSLLIDGQTIAAETAAPLRPGQRLDLVVTAVAPRIELQVIEQPLTRHLNTVLPMLGQQSAFANTVAGMAQEPVLMANLGGTFQETLRLYAETGGSAGLVPRLAASSILGQISAQFANRPTSQQPSGWYRDTGALLQQLAASPTLTPNAAIQAAAVAEQFIRTANQLEIGTVMGSTKQTETAAQPSSVPVTVTESAKTTFGAVPHPQAAISSPPAAVIGIAINTTAQAVAQANPFVQTSNHFENGKIGESAQQGGLVTQPSLQKAETQPAPAASTGTLPQSQPQAEIAPSPPPTLGLFAALSPLSTAAMPLTAVDPVEQLLAFLSAQPVLQQTKPEPHAAGYQLKELIDRLGLTMERQLADNQPERANQTLKAALLALVQQNQGTDSLPATPEHLVKTVEIYQLLQLQMADDALTLLPLSLPFLDQGFALIDHDTRSQQEHPEDDTAQTSGHSAQLHLHLEGLGSVQVDIHQQEGQIALRFMTESIEKAQFAASYREELKELLSGGPLESVQFLAGAREPVKTLLLHLASDGTGMIDTKA